MPGRWESSRRPLFVRTVWIKGIRHVVLSKNDPLLQGAMQDMSFRTSASMHGSESTPTPTPTFTSTATSSPTSISSMTSDSLSAFTTSSIETFPEADLSERLAKLTKEQNVHHVHHQAETIVPDNSDKSDDRKLLFRRKKFDRNGTAKSRRLFLPIEDSTSFDQNMGATMIRLDQNPLSDRVMKWLDLSGKSLLETTMVSDKHDLEKNRQEGKKSRGGKDLKKYMKHRSASLNIINTQYDMTLTADMRIEGNPRHPTHTVHFEDVKPEREISSRMNRMYELKRSNSVIPLSLTPDHAESIRPTTTDGAPISAKTKLHIFVPLITETDSLSEDNEDYSYF